MHQHRTWSKGVFCDCDECSDIEPAYLKLAHCGSYKLASAQSADL